MLIFFWDTIKIAVVDISSINLFEGQVGGWGGGGGGGLGFTSFIPRPFCNEEKKPSVLSFQISPST